MKHDAETNEKWQFICKTCGQNVTHRARTEECPGSHIHEFNKATGRCIVCDLPINDPSVHGIKFDEDKLPYHLIAPELLSSVAEILAFGAKKYIPRNWEKGMAWHRPFRACIGHMWDWWRGAGPDPETGKSHLWHAACCIMFLIAYEARGIGEDDRPK